MTALRLLLLFSLVACAGDGSAEGDTGGAAPDTGSVDWETVDCADAPVLTWDNFGAGFTRHYCQGCHASGVTNRYGAPEQVVFDTVDDAWLWQERILARSVGADADMPPAGGTTADDQVRLRLWLACAEEGT